MKLNKAATTERILKMKSEIKPCTKFRLDNIVFPKWSDLGLIGLIFCQRIKTKEQPSGCDYDEGTYQVVMRVLNGRVLMTGGRPDSYTWKWSKVEPYIKNLEDIRLIGVNSASAILRLAEIIATIKDDEEKKLFADMFCNLKKDLLLITTEAEDRLCIEVSQELYEAGLTACVDEWMECDENGDADATILNIGDFLIVDKDSSSVYCIRREEFLSTHKVV